MAADENLLLDSIDGPADLRLLDADDLEVLAREIRRFIVQSVSLTGGHLGSNLGVVELTLALHRVFDSPRDAILWDTGHQAYVHKIVTGRRRGFTGLRQPGGLSGYPSRSESDHDWVENSHASTILGYAHGLVTAFGLRGESERRVVAVVGDGSLTGGMAYEALNNLGHTGSNVLIVLNDNGRSYAPTVGRLARGGDAVRSFFGALGIRYVGPVDGHDLAGLERVLREAATTQDGPVVVHALTQKGLGYPPAEDDEEKCLHDTPVFDPSTGPPRWVPAGYTQAFADALVAAGGRDERVVAITAAMAGPTGLRPFEDRWPERFLDVGIAEQHGVAAAAGLAMGGLRPVVAIYSTFLTRALDQINLDVGLHRLPVVLCVDRAGITGDDGPSHHGVLDMALLSKVPGMTILAPSSAQELQVMLDDALRADGPVAIRYPKGPARQVEADQVGTGLGARRVRHGPDVCIVAVGPLLEAAEEAGRLLAHQGVDATIWDARAVKPLDPAMLADAARHPLVVTVEDGVLQGGAGTSIARALAGDQVPVLALGVPDQYIPHGNRNRILARLGLDAAGIAASIVAALGTAQPARRVPASRSRQTSSPPRNGHRFDRIDVGTTLPLAVHPRREEIERRCYEKVRPLLNEHFGNESLADRFLGQRMALWACVCYPHMADDRCLNLPAMMIPGGILDDSFSRPEVMQDAEHAARLRFRFFSVLDGTASPDFPAGRMLHEALALVTPQMSSLLKERYVDSFRQVIDSRVREAAVRGAGAVLDFEAYMGLRRTDLFGYWSTIQTEYALGVDMAGELAADPRLAHARDLVIDHMVFVNDLFSFPKEYDADETMNSIWVFLRRGGLELGEAVEKLRDLIAETEGSFVALRDEILPSVADGPVAGYLVELGHLVSGNLHYHRCTTRYGGDDVVLGEATSATW